MAGGEGVFQCGEAYASAGAEESNGLLGHG